MPGNDVGDRVHNFFAQDSLSQEQHNSPIVDGNWLAHSNNLWVGSQRQIGALTSNSKNYNLYNSDRGKGPSSYPFTSQHCLNYMQSTPRPEFRKGQSQNQQTNLNGYMYGNQFYQTRHDESKFLTIDTGYDQPSLASGGLSPYASHQGVGPEQQIRVLVRSEPCESPTSFDLFGGKQMNRQQSNMLQSLQGQQSGHSEMQQVQLMLKMQELQRQQQLEQLDTRQQDTLNQVSTLSKVASGSHPPALVHDTTNSGALNYPWSSDLGNRNWLQCGSAIIQGCSNGRTPTNIGQAQHLIPRSADQSLYGVPVSGSRGSVNPFSQGIADNPTTQPMPTFDSSFPVNQCDGLQDQARQDETFIPRQRSPADNLFGHAPSQSLTNAINMENPQQANTMQRNSAFQDFCGRQGLPVPSENSQEKAGAHVSSSQNEVGLDPAEERILFGSEDNIWSSFGKSPNMNGEGGNPFDGEELMNGISSIQSGTWSALMHSAVAETSGSDLGVQEEWSGLNFHSTEIPLGTQNLMYNSGRYKTSSAEENFPPNSSLNSVSVQPSGGTNMNNNYSNVQGHRLAYELGPSLHANSSQRLVQSSEEGNKWTNSGPRQKSAAEVSQMMFGSSSHPINREINMKKISGPLTSELGGARQLWDKTAGWGDVGSAVPSEDAALRVSSENSSNCSQDDKLKKFIQAEVVHRGVRWNSNSGHISAVDMEHVGSSIANNQVNSEVFNLQNSASVPNSSTIRGKETSQLQNNYHSDYWKNTVPFVKSTVSEGLGVLQRHVTKDNQVLHRGIGDVEAKVHEIQNRDNKKPNDSCHSNFIPHSSAANMRENILSDSNDSRSLPTRKQKSPDQAGQKKSWPRKFQCHPMGNMDEGLDPPYDRKKSSHPQSMLLQNVNHGHSEVFGATKSREELEEGQPYDVMRDGKDFTEVHLQSSFQSGGSSIPGPFNKSDLHSRNKAAQTSTNMLQLLQKVDQSSVHGSMTQLSNFEQKVSSEMPEAENSDGSVGHLHRSQSSASQGFGLQLAPPSQRVSIPNHSLSSQSTQAVRSSHSHTAEEIGEQSRGLMCPPHQGHSLPPAEHSLEELNNNRSGVPGSTYNEASLCTVPGKFSSAFDSSSCFPYLRSPLQNPPVVRATGQLSTNQSFDKHGPSSAEKSDSRRGPGSGQSIQGSLPEGAGDDKQDNPSISAGKSQLSNANGPHERLSANQVSSKEPGSVSQPISMSGIAQQGASSKMFANMWTNFPPRQPLFATQSTKESCHIHQSHPLNNMESSLSAAERQIDPDANKGWKFTSELGTSTVYILGSVEGGEERVKESASRQVPFQNIESVQMNDSQDREPVMNLTEGSPANSTSMRRDIEAFGRSLKPNNFPHPNYSLLNQMQAMKDVETYPSERPLKRMRVSGSNMGVQQILSADSRILSFSGRENLQRSVSSQQGGNVTPQDELASHYDDAQSSSPNNCTNSLKPEHTQISPQMAPSWFNQYGTFKNAQMLQMYEANRAASMKTTGQPFTLGKCSSGLQAFDSIQRVIPANADRSNLGQSSFASSAVVEDFSSPQTLPLNVGQHDQLLKPKKRKRVTSELTPWCKEVSPDSGGKQTISFAETEWAKLTNTLVEKVEEDSDLIELGPRMLKVKRRLILTTQLMQQLFRPPPFTILFSDANSEYENVAYSTSRLALVDACSIGSCSNGDCNAPDTSKELFHDKHKRSERYDNHMFPKAVEQLTVRARRLESDFSRLDKRASILDVIVEGQDIEKFSVMYRFAKFHGRAQSDGVDTSSSSDACSHKPLEQRYVTVLPMPKNLPSMVQCLSL